MEREILTVEEAADMLGSTPEFIVELLSSNELPGRLVSGEWRTTKRALVSFVDGVPLVATCCTTDSCCTPASQSSGQGAVKRCC